MKKCHTIEPSIEHKRKILKELSTSFDAINDVNTINTINTTHKINNDGIIKIGIIFHMCDRANGAEDDINIVIDTLNKDFNKKADNFNIGKEIFKMPTFPTLSQPKKKLSYIPITPKLKKNLKKMKNVIKINDKRKKINIDINKTNFNIIKDNELKIKNYYAQLKNYKLYNDYVSRAGSANLEFYHIKTLYSPIQPITNDNLDVIDKLVKIDASPVITPDKHLNIWVVDMNSTGILGYAQFPWDISQKFNTDGVVISSAVFGKKSLYPEYSLNKTVVHEVGHWLGLYHNFQSSFSQQGGVMDNNNDGKISQQEKTGDLISDTVPQSQPTYGNPLKNKDMTNMFMLHMDYTDDIAMFMMTKEQCAKMRKIISVYRAKLE